MANRFNPLNQSVCLETPQRLVFPNAWVTHIPFAMYIISAIKPSIFVELGTHIGNSYCGFCQAVDHLKLTTKCFAVDTWEGDEHAGFYSSVVFEGLSSYHDPRYGSFSRLMKMTFDEAKDYFSDASISLLHIDGLHTYEAVKHDFENWRSKLSENAIVIFHDTNVREREFGVWKFWEELAPKFPHLEFLHGNGLGVICLGQPDQVGVADLFDPAQAEDVRIFFFTLGAANNFPIEKDQLQQVIKNNDKVYKEHLAANWAEQSAIVEKMTNDLAERDQAMEKLTNDLVERDEAMEKLTNDLVERDEAMKKLTNDLAKRDEAMKKLTNDLAKRDEAMKKLTNDLAKRDEAMKKLTNDLAERDEAMKKLETVLTESQKELVQYTQSTSWKLTRPFRKISKYLQRNNSGENTKGL